jgi:hypothetical protein
MIGEVQFGSMWLNTTLNFDAPIDLAASTKDSVETEGSRKALLKSNLFGMNVCNS